jgi:SNF2 family DNA or RNA helicase
MKDTEHIAYYNRLRSDLSCSGKCSTLAALLLETGVAFDDEVSSDFDSKTLRSALFPVGDDELVQSESLGSSSVRDVVLKNGKRMPVFSDRGKRAAKKRRSDDSDSDSGDEEHRCKPLSAAANIGSIFGDARSIKKCLIFVQHKKAMDIVESTVLKRCFSSVRYARIDGSTPLLQRTAIIDEFSQSAENGRQSLRLLVMTTRSCGLGLNLSAADTVLFLEHDWNPFVDLQAMDRAHRLGQTKPVTVYRIIGIDAL